MFLDRAYADTKIGGNIWPGFSIEPKTPENRACPLRQPVDHRLQDEELLACNEACLGTWSFIQIGRIAAMCACPVFFAAYAPTCAAAMKEEVIGRHPVQIAARFANRPRLAGQER
jgi:hypothetical protein